MIALEHRMNAVQGHWCDRNDTRVQSRKKHHSFKASNQFVVGDDVQCGDEDVLQRSVKSIICALLTVFLVIVDVKDYEDLNRSDEDVRGTKVVVGSKKTKLLLLFLLMSLIVMI